MIQIAIADDHVIFLDGLSSLISGKRNIECVGLASDANELLELASKYPIDVAVIDINMPGMNGIDLSIILKEKYPNIKTLILSSFKDKRKIQEALEGGISGYILKEKGQEELEKAIVQIYNGKEYYTDAVLQIVLDIVRNGAKEKENNYRAILTQREIDVLTEIVNGLTTPQIAQKLFISESTVASHRKNIHSKFGVSKMNQLIRFVSEHDVLDN